jgi:hypothetical protein
MIVVQEASATANAKGSLDAAAPLDFIAIPDAALRARSGFRFGFAQAGDAVAWFPLAAFLKQLDPLESF